jgi:hypothetical protein
MSLPGLFARQQPRALRGCKAVRRRSGAALSGQRDAGFSNRKHIGDENLFSSVRRVAKHWPYASLTEGRGPPFEFSGKLRSQERSGLFFA